MTVSTTDQHAMKGIGRRLKQYRLQLNLPLSDLAQLAGLSKTTIVNAEAGANPSLETLIRILRVLGRLDALEAFLPPNTVSPIQLADRQGKLRQRARRTTKHATLPHEYQRAANSTDRQTMTSTAAVVAETPKASMLNGPVVGGPVVRPVNVAPTKVRSKQR